VARASLARIEAEVSAACGDLIACAFRVATAVRSKAKAEADTLEKCAARAQDAWRKRDEFLMRHAKKGSK
jgi:hypothetical protein